VKLLEIEATADNLDVVRIIIESVDAHVGRIQMHLVAPKNGVAIDVILSERQVEALRDALR